MALEILHHLMRMNDGKYPKIALLGGVYGIRQRGRPNKCCIDGTKEDCGTLDMTMTQASRIAQDRNNWRTTLNRLLMHASALPGHK